MTPHLSPAQSVDPAPALFADRFNAPIPRGLRERTDGMSWDSVVAAYGHSPGPVRLGHWECTDTDRPSRRLGPQARNYQATIAFGDRISTSTAAASGPVAALTAMLHERGVAVEMLKFHQLRCGADTATFVHGSDGAHDEWAIGWSQDATQSALRALIACANRLFAAP
jgi:hypothetical protein